jgi:hypothetical protein
MEWDVEGTNEFDQWFDGLTEEERDAVIRVVDMLEADGPDLKFPQTSDIRRSRHSKMRELRIQHAGRPYRVLYAFDPRRTAILLLGGDKTGDSRWYERNIPIADRLYDVYLRELEEEGLI